MSDLPSPQEQSEPLEAVLVEPAGIAKPPIRTAPLAWTEISPYADRSWPPVSASPSSLWRIESPGPAQFVVPRTFGMSAILGITTALALLFGGFQWYDAHPVLYLFFGVQAIVICLAQMLYGKTPRAASAITGALIMPVFLIVMVGLSGPRRAEGALCLLVFSVPLGAFLGYITGTMAAGVFLVMDTAERFFWPGETRESA